MQSIHGNPLARVRVACALVLALLVAGAAPAQTRPAKAPVSPTAFVTAIYRDHFAHNQRWDITFKRHHAQFAKPLLDAFAEDDKWAAAHPDEVPNLDGDPLTSSQEMCRGYSVGAATEDGEDMIVPVTIRIPPETRTVRVKLVLTNGTWQIANILYDEGPDLVTLLKEPHQ